MGLPCTNIDECALNTHNCTIDRSTCQAGIKEPYIPTAVGLSDLKSTKTLIPPGYWRLILLPMQAWLGIWCREDAPSIWYNTGNLYQCYIRPRKNSWIWRYGCPDGGNEQNNYDGLWTRRQRTAGQSLKRCRQLCRLRRMLRWTKYDFKWLL